MLTPVLLSSLWGFEIQVYWERREESNLSSSLTSLTSLSEAFFPYPSSTL